MLPLDSSVRASGDAGVPILQSDPENPVSQAIMHTTQAIVNKINKIDEEEANQPRGKGLLNIIR